MNTLLSAAAVHGPTVLAVDPTKVKAGWLALVIVLLMCLATYLLWRSMNRQLKKVDFDDGSTDERGAERARPAGRPGEPARNGAPRDGSGPAGSTPDDGPVPDGDGGASRP
jgi:hypothetical protein